MRNPDTAEPLATIGQVPVAVGAASLRIEDAVRVARGQQRAQLRRDPGLVAQIRHGAKFREEDQGSEGTLARSTADTCEQVWPLFS